MPKMTENTNIDIAGATTEAVVVTFVDVNKLVKTPLLTKISSHNIAINSSDTKVMTIDRVKFFLKFSPLSRLMMLATNHVLIAISSIQMHNMITDVMMGRAIPVSTSDLSGISIMMLAASTIAYKRAGIHVLLKIALMFVLINMYAALIHDEKLRLLYNSVSIYFSYL
jgi:hypothetical protein